MKCTHAESKKALLRGRLRVGGGRGVQAPTLWATGPLLWLVGPGGTCDGPGRRGLLPTTAQPPSSHAFGNLHRVGLARRVKLLCKTTKVWIQYCVVTHAVLSIWAKLKLTHTASTQRARSSQVNPVERPTQRSPRRKW